MKVKEKGFTLIELLAVIVILAIIALIAAPIVLEIIEDSKDSSNKRSVDGYAKAVENAVATYQIENTTGKIEGTFTTTNGKLLEGETTLTVDYDGDVVCDVVEVYSDGNIYLENCKVNGALVDYTFGTKQENSAQEGSTVSICTFANVGTEGEIGAKYECEVKEGTTYNFYILSHNYDENDNTKIVSTNLIMERNICGDGTVATAENTCTVAYNSSGNASCVDCVSYGAYGVISGAGPVTAMSHLNNATSGWREELTLNEIYDDEGGAFTGFVLNGKARLPKLSEINVYNSTNKTNAYLYDYLDLYVSGNIQTNPISGIYGYWTLSAGGAGDASGVAWYVGFFGSSEYDSVYLSSHYGIRPVITLSL